jgi:hypothetical protein
MPSSLAGVCMVYKQPAFTNALHGDAASVFKTHQRLDDKEDTMMHTALKQYQLH